MFKRIPKIIFYAILLVVLVEGGCASSSQTQAPLDQEVVKSTIQKSFGENLVEFILKVVGKKSKKIDDSLVRDDV